ncbi:MAG: hypothetical protein IAF38_11455 [Bacteroidia bacterium]|nr:hypothetical protein [Bacteroidia bacterium]
MRKYIYILVCFVSATSVFCQKSISDIIKKIPLSTCYSADLSPSDTIVDIKNGYYEISSAYDKTKITLIEAALFKNTDSTATIAVSGLKADEQCSFHHIYFYEYNWKTDNIKPIADKDVLPEFNLKMFFKKSSVKKTLLPYLKAIQKAYLTDSAGIDDVLDEIYSYRFLIPRSGTTLMINLDICDYIPTNVVGIKPADWKIVETDFKKITLRYDKKKKRFFVSSN